MKKVLVSLIVISMFTVFLMTSDAGDSFKYVGAKKCKTCHNTKKIGKQYEVWSKGPHAGAIKSLAGEKSIEYAKKNDIEDPAKEPGCLKCHATAAAVDKSQIDKKGKLVIEEGVSCESCHGPGSGYKKNSIMKDVKKAMANGLIPPAKEVCVTCHNKENPFHKPFDYKKAVDRIAHPVPGN